MSADGATPGILRTFRESPLAVKALLLGVLVNKLGAFLQVFLVLFVTSRGFTDLQGGLALGVYGVGSVLGVLLGGSFTDRVGARLTIVAGMGGTAVLLVAVLYMRSYPLLLLSVGLVGAISQVYRPAAAAVMSELTPRERQVMVFAMYRLALNLGTTVAPLLGAALLSVSYNLLFWGEAVAALAYAVIALIALPRRPIAVPGRERSNAGYGAVLKDRRYLAYVLAMLLNSAVYVQYLSTLPLTVRDAGYDTFWYGVLVAINGAVVIGFELLMTKVVQTWRIRTVLTVGFTLLGTGMALYALPGGLAILVAATLIWTLAEIIEGPTMFAYPAMAGSEQTRGRYLGAAHAMFGIGAAIGPIAGVTLWVAVGSTAWIVFGLVSVLALVPALYGVAHVGARVSASEVTS